MKSQLKPKMKYSLSSDYINTSKNSRSPTNDISILNKKSKIETIPLEVNAEDFDSTKLRKTARGVSFKETEAEIYEESKVAMPVREKEDIAEELEVTMHQGPEQVPKTTSSEKELKAIKIGRPLVQGPKQVPNAIPINNCESNSNKKEPVTELESTSTSKLPLNEKDGATSASKPIHANIILSSFAQGEEIYSKRNRSFRKIKKMIGNLSTELNLAEDDIDQGNVVETNDVIATEPDINAFFLKDCGNDLLRFDFVPSLELKSKSKSDNFTLQSLSKAPYNKGRETILHMKRMTDIISMVDFGK